MKSNSNNKSKSKSQYYQATNTQGNLSKRENPINNNNNNKLGSLEESLVDLYLSVKIRKLEELAKLSIEDIEQERNNIRKMNPITIVDYIKSSIDILINLKIEEKLQYERKRLIENNPQHINQNIVQSNLTYEKVIRELESTISSIKKNEVNYKNQLDALKLKYESLERDYFMNACNNKNSNISSMTKSKSRDKMNAITNRTSQTSSHISQSKNSDYYYPHKSARVITNPINYNFNNPIVIYGNRNFNNRNDSSIIEHKEEQDTVNYQLNQSTELRSHSTNSNIKQNKSTRNQKPSENKYSALNTNRTLNSKSPLRKQILTTMNNTMVTQNNLNNQNNHTHQNINPSNYLSNNQNNNRILGKNINKTSILNNISNIQRKLKGSTISLTGKNSTNDKINYNFSKPNVHINNNNVNRSNNSNNQGGYSSLSTINYGVKHTNPNSTNSYNTALTQDNSNSRNNYINKEYSSNTSNNTINNRTLIKNTTNLNYNRLNNNNFLINNHNNFNHSPSPITIKNKCYQYKTISTHSPNLGNTNIHGRSLSALYSNRSGN